MPPATAMPSPANARISKLNGPTKTSTKRGNATVAAITEAKARR